MSKKNVILASTSRHRRALLERTGLGSIQCVAPKCDERIHDPNMKPDDIVKVLAERKARSVGEDHPKSLIIGSDQVAELDGNVLGKPKTRERAIEQLLLLSGRVHRLLTAVCVYEPETDRSEVAIDIHEMAMWDLSEERARRYVDHDKPLDCAGSYRVESLGVTLFRSMKGRDFTAIVGLPLCQVSKVLDRFGVFLLDLGSD